MHVHSMHWHTKAITKYAMRSYQIKLESAAVAYLCVCVGVYVCVCVCVCACVCVCNDAYSMPYEGECTHVII